LDLLLIEAYQEAEVALFHQVVVEEEALLQVVVEVAENLEVEEVLNVKWVEEEVEEGVEEVHFLEEEVVVEVQFFLEVVVAVVEVVLVVVVVVVGVVMEVLFSL
jgi:hypothetical protein